MEIYDATTNDLVEITEIYNDAVRNTTAIWNETVVDTRNRRSWLHHQQSKGYPVLVARDESNAVLGVASFGDWRHWEGYRYTVEHSVYVRPDHQGKGIGESLMCALIDRARQMRKHVMVAGIEANNTGSKRLHTKLGFVYAGHLTEVGCKFGEWLDLDFMLLHLDSHSNPSS